MTIPNRAERRRERFGNPSALFPVFSAIKAGRLIGDSPELLPAFAGGGYAESLVKLVEDLNAATKYSIQNVAEYATAIDDSPYSDFAVHDCLIPVQKLSWFEYAIPAIENRGGLRSPSQDAGRRVGLLVRKTPLSPASYRLETAPMMLTLEALPRVICPALAFVTLNEAGRYVHRGPGMDEVPTVSSGLTNADWLANTCRILPFFRGLIENSRMVLDGVYGHLNPSMWAIAAMNKADVVVTHQVETATGLSYATIDTSRVYTKTAPPGYAAEALRKVVEGESKGQVVRGRVSTLEIRHDDWCDLLQGKGSCNCSPEVGEPKLL